MSFNSATACRAALEHRIRQACLLEAFAPKAGNVHPAAAFEDLCHDDFVRSAEVAAPHLAQARDIGVGRAVLHAVTATQSAVTTNTNLGICLLIAPLAAAPPDDDWRQAVHRVLEQTTRQDAALVYEAIRIAKPGGLGTVDKQDVAAAPTQSLLEVMRLAADRDGVARQYAADFADVHRGVQILKQWRDRRLPTAVVGLQLSLLAETPDTLIARKCGAALADEASRRAAAVLDAGWPDAPRGRSAFRNYDQWLRADGHRRNPGTTADLIAAILFVALREGVLSLESGTSDH